MSLYEAQGNIAKATKDLLTKWQQTKMSWQDEQAERFEEEVLRPLDRDQRAAGEGISTMNQLVQQARRDCSA